MACAIQHDNAIIPLQFGEPAYTQQAKPARPRAISRGEPTGGAQRPSCMSAARRRRARFICGASGFCQQHQRNIHHGDCVLWLRTPVWLEGNRQGRRQIARNREKQCNRKARPMRHEFAYGIRRAAPAGRRGKSKPSRSTSSVEIWRRFVPPSQGQAGVRSGRKSAYQEKRRKVGATKSVAWQPPEQITSASNSAGEYPNTRTPRHRRHNVIVARHRA